MLACVTDRAEEGTTTSSLTTLFCSALRASFCALLSALYVDVDPHERYECIPVARLWHELPRVSAHGESWKQRT